MGFDIAKSANFGSFSYLVSGPTHLKVAHPLDKIINVVSAQEMYDACHLYFKDVDVAIAAAVADYRPKNCCIPKKKVIG
jgi:phosphopantothenoylcysteine decarboxylase/phosphopantothenate--cysteine ligase